MKCQVHSSADANCPFYEFLVGVQAKGSNSHPVHFESSGNSFCIFHLPNDAKCPGLGPKSSWGNNSKKFLEMITNDFVDYCSQCERLVDFADVHFPFELTLKNKRIGDANFSGAHFKGGCNFERTKFSGVVAFISSQFLGAANFSRVAIQDIDCSRAVFKHGANFRHAEFMGAAIFDRCNFNRTSTFEASVFAEAIFTDAIFRDVSFQNTKIGGVALFGDAEFEGSLIFDGAKIGDLADFSSSVPKAIGGDRRLSRGGSSVSFEDTVFDGPAIFENRIFRTGANFTRTVFSTAPIFHGCTHHQGTIFPSRSGFQDSSAESINAYTTLKLAMGEMKRSREEGMFYALEQKCLRNDSNTPLSARFASTIYELANDYGQSYVRPLIWLALLTFLMVPIYIDFGAWTATNGQNISSNAWTFSLEQVFRPFYAWRTDLASAINVVEAGNQLAVKIVATIQSAFSIGLITLSVLALRWRFRRP